MNRPFRGKIAWLPDFIGEELMRQQELQGNKRDISVFEKDNTANKKQGGFDWIEAEQGDIFWSCVLSEKNINLFLAWFKPELEVWDYDDDKHIVQVLGYFDDSRYQFLTKKQPGIDFMYTHAQLPKKEDKAKTELLKKVEELTKQANELLTKAAEAKKAAEKL